MKPGTNYFSSQAVLYCCYSGLHTQHIPHRLCRFFLRCRCHMGVEFADFILTEPDTIFSGMLSSGCEYSVNDD